MMSRFSRANGFSTSPRDMVIEPMVYLQRILRVYEMAGGGGDGGGVLRSGRVVWCGVVCGGGVVWCGVVWRGVAWRGVVGGLRISATT